MPPTNNNNSNNNNTNNNTNNMRRSLVANKILKLKDLLMLPDITKILTYLNAGSALLVLTMSVQAFYTVHGHTYILTHAHTPTHRCGR